jgi:predicted transcriptional regulator
MSEEKLLMVEDRRELLVLSIVREKPGCLVGEIASEIGFHPNFVRKKLQQLEKSGLLVSKGGYGIPEKWFPVSKGENPNQN